MRGKPDTEMFVYTAQCLIFIFERCIVFGNSNSNLEATHDARTKCVAEPQMVMKPHNKLFVADLKNLADIDLPKFEPELEMEQEADEAYPSRSVGDDDNFW
ncbi:hypothetical protein AQUCO_06100035v1 [Aquilegia coerulea]|uniref:Uncharacterized protein n=1 Tax=Aquilegia coerulea TaxID=218851 RepID=A0A2G5CDB4_AQUCA|nr:hypothetical protein AQUCO_06100035v1 [Aquilegia coerulea]